MPEKIRFDRQTTVPIGFYGKDGIKQGTKPSKRSANRTVQNGSIRCIFTGDNDYATAEMQMKTAGELFPNRAQDVPREP